jgi:hypothetical protein
VFRILPHFIDGVVYRDGKSDPPAFRGDRKGDAVSARTGHGGACGSTRRLFQTEGTSAGEQLVSHILTFLFGIRNANCLIR